MRFSCGYNDLVSNLADVASIAEHSLSNERDKNIIFKFKKEADGTCHLKLIALSKFVILKRTLDEDAYQLTLEDSEVDSNGVLFYQINSKELMGYLNSYKSLRRSKVEEVIFENGERGLIKCTVIESEKVEAEQTKTDEMDFMPAVYEEPQHTVRTYVSHWMFDNIPIKPNMLNDINLEAGTSELVSLPSVFVDLITSSLLPIMKSDTDMFSHLMFDDKNVIAFNQAFTTVMANLVAEGGILSGIKLNHSCISYLNKLIINQDEIQIARLDRYIYVKTENSETFLIYDTQLANYQNAVALFTKGHFIAVNRIYLKDVLKRLSLVNDGIEFYINASEGKITLSNTKFSQDIDMDKQEGMEGYPLIRFKIMPDVLSKAIIGNDDKYTQYEEADLESLGENAPYAESTFIYYCPNANNPSNASIVFGDVTENWFSVARVKTY